MRTGTWYKLVLLRVVVIRVASLYNIFLDGRQVRILRLSLGEFIP